MATAGECPCLRVSIYFAVFCVALLPYSGKIRGMVVDYEWIVSGVGRGLESCFQLLI
jgi:hypothetical protein